MQLLKLLTLNHIAMLELVQMELQKYRIFHLIFS